MGDGDGRVIGKGQISVPGPNGETGKTRELGENSGHLYSGGGGGAGYSSGAGGQAENTGGGGKAQGSIGQNGFSGNVIIRKTKK